jgi:hypothetical protein
LFKNVKPGGIFVIEDLYTSHSGSFSSFSLKPTDTNTLDMLFNFNTTGKIVSNYMTDEEIDYLNTHIDKCVVEMANTSEIAFIYKKR